MILILPTGLDFDSHIRLHPPTSYGIEDFRIEVAQYLVTLIFQIPASNKKLAENIVDGYVPMNAQLLQKRCGRAYHLYLNYLVATGILQTDNYFIPTGGKVSGKSRGYRLTQDHQGDTLSYKPIMDKKLRKRLLKELKENIDPEYAHLTKWLGANTQLRIDLPAALLYLKQRCAFLLDHPESRDIKHYTEIVAGIAQKREKLKDPVLQYEHGYMNALAIDQHAIYSQVDANVGRLHTPLTNSKSELRHFLKHGNQTLVSIDLKNSQPYLSNIFFNPAFWSISTKAPKRKNEAQNAGDIQITDYQAMKATFKLQLTNKSKKQTQTKTTPLIILAEMGKMIDNEIFNEHSEKIQSEIALYKELTSDGSLYKYLEDQFSIVLGSSFRNKRAVKSIIFTVFFTDNRYQDPVKKLFKQLFPVVTRMFAIIKQKDRTILPRLLQSIEAYLFLRVITKQVAKINPRIPLYTIHDSIVTTEQYVPIVKKVMRDVLIKYIGVVPTFTEERWDPSQLASFDTSLKSVA